MGLPPYPRTDLGLKYPRVEMIVSTNRGPEFVADVCRVLNMALRNLISLPVSEYIVNVHFTVTERRLRLKRLSTVKLSTGEVIYEVHLVDPPSMSNWSNTVSRVCYLCFFYFKQPPLHHWGTGDVYLARIWMRGAPWGSEPSPKNIFTECFVFVTLVYNYGL